MGRSRMPSLALAGRCGWAAWALACAHPPHHKPADDSAAPDDTGPPEALCGGVPASLAVGTGDIDFRALTAGDGVTMIHGPQGGWHMLGSVQVTGMTPIIRVVFEVTHQRTAHVVASNTYQVQTIYEAETCTGVYPGMYGYLEVDGIVNGEADTPPELMAGDLVDFCMSAEDEDGRAASGCVEVTALADPADLAG
jgi:hypothetical protein